MWKRVGSGYLPVALAVCLGCSPKAAPLPARLDSRPSAPAPTPATSTAPSTVEVLTSAEPSWLLTFRERRTERKKGLTPKCNRGLSPPSREELLRRATRDRSTKDPLRAALAFELALRYLDALSKRRRSGNSSSQEQVQVAQSVGRLYRKIRRFDSTWCSANHPLTTKSAPPSSGPQFENLSCYAVRPAWGGCADELLYRLGFELEQAGAGKEAVAHLAELTKLWPDSDYKYWAAWVLAEHFRAADNLDGAAQTYGAVIAGLSHDPVAVAAASYRRGLVLAQQGDSSGAEAAFEHALNAVKDHSGLPLVEEVVAAVHSARRRAAVGSTAP